jgi:hypothetical protein
MATQIVLPFTPSPRPQPQAHPRPIAQPDRKAA